MVSRLRLLQVGDIHLPSAMKSGRKIDQKDTAFSVELRNLISSLPIKVVFRQTYKILKEGEVGGIVFMGDLTNAGDLAGYDKTYQFIAHSLQLGRGRRHFERPTPWKKNRRWCFTVSQNRSQSKEERVIGTILTLLFKKMKGASYDVARLRLYGFDPNKQVLCSLQKAREFLDRACMTYNVTRHRGLMDRQPALVWKQALGRRKLNVIRDVDEFRRSIGIIKHDLKLTSAGIEVNNLRYTPGAKRMPQILQEFERAVHKPKGDITSASKRSNDDRKGLGFKGKVKVDEDDISAVQVWLPYANPPRWEAFFCSTPSLEGIIAGIRSPGPSEITHLPASRIQLGTVHLTSCGMRAAGVTSLSPIALPSAMKTSAARVVLYRC